MGYISVTDKMLSSKFTTLCQFVFSPESKYGGKFNVALEKVNALCKEKTSQLQCSVIYVAQK